MSTTNPWWTMPGEVAVSLYAFEWDPELKRDVPSTSLQVGVSLPIDSVTGREFTFKPNSPQELWEFCINLSTDPKGTLQQHFGYSGPTAAPPRPAIDLSDLEIEL